jgi:ABC-type amino acid transport substrate-binding protein
MRARVDFTDPYYRTPARFVARRDSPITDPLPERLEGKKVAVTAGSAHEAYLKALFTEVEVRPYPTTVRSISCSAMRSRSRFGSMAPIPRIAALSAAGPISTAAISGRASALRSESATTPSGSP